MRLTVHEAIADIAADEWNGLAGSAFPFLRHEFLLAAEQTGCVSPDAGWAPRHLALHDDDRLIAVMPLYQKQHSWGEFVFDWSWARAYEQAGLPYYPKLVSSVPFTPAPSPRLLLAPDAGERAARALVDGAIELTRESGCSSLHILFPSDDELSTLRESGLRLRKDCQFHWHNRGYEDFDAFLQTFTAAKRKKARRDRRRVREAGIRFRRLRGGEIDLATWEVIYQMISMTFMRRGSLPYYSLEFFVRIGRELSQSLLVILAEQRDSTIAAAVFFEGADTLYGRYWGSSGYHDALHFETCYYQGIEHCIEHGISVFEPGTQGEHKISRGFTPVSTWSAHWLVHAEFLAAIDNYLDEETRHVDRYMRAIDAHSPYRKDDTDPSS